MSITQRLGEIAIYGWAPDRILETCHKDVKAHETFLTMRIHRIIF